MRPNCDREGKRGATEIRPSDYINFGAITDNQIIIMKCLLLCGHVINIFMELSISKSLLLAISSIAQYYISLYLGWEIQHRVVTPYMQASVDQKWSCRDQILPILMRFFAKSPCFVQFHYNKWLSRWKSEPPHWKCGAASEKGLPDTQKMKIWPKKKSFLKSICSWTFCKKTHQNW